MFQTLASRDDIEVSGIGLTIVKKKVQAHGGDVRVESAPPTRGSTFIFTWKEDCGVKGNPLTILLIDDDKIDIMAVKRSFRDLKIANPVIEAHNGIEGLEHLRGENGREKAAVALPGFAGSEHAAHGRIEFLEQLRAR